MKTNDEKVEAFTNLAEKILEVLHDQYIPVVITSLAMATLEILDDAGMDLEAYCRDLIRIKKELAEAEKGDDK